MCLLMGKENLGNGGKEKEKYGFVKRNLWIEKEN